VTHVSLFSGIGGLDLAAEWAGFETVLFCERDPYCQKVLAKHWPGVPIIDDIRNIKCEHKDNKTLIYEILKEQSKQPDGQKLLLNVRSAESNSLSTNPRLQKVEDSVAGNAGLPECVGEMDQTQEAEHGCAVRTTQTGKMEMDTRAESEPNTTKKSENGDGIFSQEINTPVNLADTGRGKRTFSERITSKNGVNTQSLDSTFKTESRSAGTATKRLIVEMEGKIDVISAGVPCQPASNAGKRRGTEDDRWLWPEFMRVVKEVQPNFAVAENVSGILSLDGGMAFEDLLSEMELAGYEVLPLVYPAAGVGANHKRDRVFIVGYSERMRELQPERRKQDKRGRACYTSETLANSLKLGRGRRNNGDERRHGGEVQITGSGASEESGILADHETLENTERDGCRTWRTECERQQGGPAFICSGSRGKGKRGCPTKSRLGGMVDGVSHWLHEPEIPRVTGKSKTRKNRLRALGNAVVPQQAYPIFKAIRETMNNEVNK
jgi:DNA (cytosine-5)-methyltransferase 1